MCSNLTRTNFSAEIIKYRLAVYNRKSKEKYVYFYVLDPQSVIDGSPKLKRIRTKFNNYPNAKERDAAAMRYVLEVNNKLASGWNPLIDDGGKKSWTSLETVFERYSKYLDKCQKDDVLKQKTYIDYCSRLRMFEEFVSKHPLAYIYQYDKVYCDSFLNYVYIDRDNSARTRNNYLIWLSSFSTWLVDNGYIASNPCSKIKSLHTTDKIRKAIDKDTMKRIDDYLQETDKNFYLAVKFAYYTLIRPSEMSNIKLGDISLTNQTVFVNKDISKNRRDGVVTLPKALINILIDCNVFAHPDDYFLFGKGFIPSSEHYSSRQFNERWQQLRKDLNLPKEYMFYSLKDTGITNMINDVGLNIAKDQARHSSVSITNHYASKDQMHAHPELKDYK